MRKTIGLLAVIFLLYKGYGLYQKFSHAKHLKIGLADFQFENFNLSSLFSDVTAHVQVSIDNFSKSVFTIEQIKVDVYSESGQLIAEQTEPLSRKRSILSNQKNVLPLSFLISSNKVKTLIKQSGGVVKLGANYLSSGDYGIPIHLKGFIVSEGISIDINEKLTV